MQMIEFMHESQRNFRSRAGRTSAIKVNSWSDVRVLYCKTLVQRVTAHTGTYIEFEATLTLKFVYNWLAARTEHSGIYFE
jgi:hypothetical protein